MKRPLVSGAKKLPKARQPASLSGQIPAQFAFERKKKSGRNIMHDFTFQNPTRIIFGRNRETEIGRELIAAGHRRVLLVYGRNFFKQSHLFDRVAASLRENDVQFVEFGGVVPNPVLSHARDGVLLARREKVEAILAVGGGSVLDEAKAIAAGVLSGRDVWEFYTGMRITAALPVFTILTLAATGSEMNGNSVITNEITKEKFSTSSPHLFPRISILNPELTFSVPPDYTAYSAVDAIAHVIEGYFTGSGANRLQDRLTEAIITTIMETTGAILKKPDDYQARAEFEWAATLALNGITTAGIGEFGFPNHMIEHSLSALYDLPHGAGLAMVIPAWMKWYRNRNPEKFSRFAREIFRQQSADAGILALEEWFKQIGAPVRLAEAGIPAAEIEEIAVNALRLAEKWQLHEIYDREAIIEILRLGA
jgi:NADP-dependent alcohol dehydrogenase